MAEVGVVGRVGRVALLIASVALAVAIFEGMLFLRGYPDRLHQQIANPPNLRLFVDNVEYRYWWETNAQGLRYPDIPFRKPPGECRVFVVGDSITDGVGDAVEDRYTDRLERIFSRREASVAFINAGLGGQGPLQYARIFHWLGVYYQPNSLLISINVNDLMDVAPNATSDDIVSVELVPDHGLEKLARALVPRTWRQYRILRGSSEQQLLDLERFDLEQTIAVARGKGISELTIQAWQARLPPEWVAWATQGRIEPYLLYLPLYHPDVFLGAIDVEGPTYRKRWRAMRSILTELVHDACRRGIEVAAVFMPDLYEYDASIYEPDGREPYIYLGGRADPEWLEGENEIQRRLTLWAEQLDLPFLDLTNDFRNAYSQGVSLHFPIDGHWNEAGHSIAAGLIARWLRESAVFTCLL